MEEDIIIKCGLEEMMKRFFKDYVIVWHDPHAFSEENKQYIAQLEKFCEVQTYPEWKDASEFLAKTKATCHVITSGTNGEAFVKEIHPIQSAFQIYIFCGSKEYHLNWSKDYPKVTCVKTQIQNILDQIRENLLQWYQRTSSLKTNLPAFAPIFNDEDKSEMNHLHLYLKILPNFKNRSQAKNDILSLSRAIYSNEKDASFLKAFEKNYNEYNKEAILKWYTQESFLYKITNNCLRLASSDSIQYCRLLLKDIEQAIKEQYQEKSKNFHGLLYRGAYLSEEEWLSLKGNINGEIEMHGFLSVSKDKDRAFNFIEADLSKNVFITILVPKGPNDEKQGFAEIEEFSRFPLEKEVLFNVRSRFTILETEDEYSKKLPYRHLVLLYGSQGFRKYVAEENPMREVSFPNTEEISCLCKTSAKMFFQPIEDLSNDVYFCKNCLPKDKNIPLLCLPRDQHTKSIKLQGILMKYPTGLKSPMFGYKCRKCQAKKQEMYYKCTECSGKVWCDNCIDDETCCIQEGHGMVFERSPFIFWSERMSENELNHLKYQNKILDWADTFQIGKMHFRCHEYQKAVEYYSAYIQKQKEIDEKLAIAYNNMADAYKSQAEYQRAFKCYLIALKIGKIIHGDNHSEFATSFHGLAGIYCIQADYNKALEYYGKALEIDKLCYGENHHEVAAIYCSMGQVYHLQAEYEKALESHSKALEIYKSCYGDRHQKVATCYSNLAQVYSLQGEFNKALGYYSKALEIFKSLYGSKHPHVAICYDSMGLIFDTLAEYKKSLEYHSQALKIYEEKHPNAATCYNNLGHVYFKQADYKQALENFSKAFEIYRPIHGDKHPHIATCYSNMSLVFNTQGQSKKAHEYYSKALEIYQSFYGENHPEVATCHSNIGQVYRSQAEDKKALQCFSKALEIYLSFYGKDHPHIATCFRNIGLVYFSQADYKRALQYFSRALEIYRPIYGENHPHVAICFEKMGLLFTNRAEYETANDYHLKALEIRKKFYGESHPDVADSLCGIGKMHFFLGEKDEALEYYKKSLEMKKKFFDDSHPALANMYCYIGQVSNSLDYHLKSLGIRKRVFENENHPDIAESYSGIGRVHFGKGEYEKALEYQFKSLEIIESVYHSCHPGVATIYQDIANTFKSQGESKKALEYESKSMDIIKIVFGEGHPHILTVSDQIQAIFNVGQENAKEVKTN